MFNVLSPHDDQLLLRNRVPDFSRACVLAREASRESSARYHLVQDDDGYTVAMFMSGVRVGLQPTWPHRQA
jgi:hypothetical protein